MRKLVFVVLLICGASEASGQYSSWEFRRIRESEDGSDTIFVELHTAPGKYLLKERFSDFEEWVITVDSVQKQELSLHERNGEKTYLISSFEKISKSGWSEPSYQERHMQEGVHYKLSGETKVFFEKLTLQRGEFVEHGVTYTFWMLPDRQLLLREMYRLFINTPSGVLLDCSGTENGRTQKLELVSYKQDVTFPEGFFSLLPPAEYKLFVPKPVEPHLPVMQE